MQYNVILKNYNAIKKGMWFELKVHKKTYIHLQQKNM
jgi:hypothetical protein